MPWWCLRRRTELVRCAEPTGTSSPRLPRRALSRLVHCGDGPRLLVRPCDRTLVRRGDRTLVRPDDRSLRGGAGDAAVTTDGRVVGTWRCTTTRRSVAVEVDPWVAWTERRRAQVRRRAEQYAQHLGLALAEGSASTPTSP
ncbi:DNA glycosylase AlkZ-like family protein [Frigoribacterium sp. ACAM 257]|uniref:DNA glycosylase AlkZ-like family protein n=1 Tax=Frigoribacterium sp. ACAM 257 TaxID=2508998 RepID=UPI0021053E38|nr:crosslink repair DNA glycosylase YcaQ family protein [Frigoribacterium sp. ACAM 257]